MIISLRLYAFKGPDSTVLLNIRTTGTENEKVKEKEDLLCLITLLGL